MGKFPFSDDFKRDAVAQLTERGYSLPAALRGRVRLTLPKAMVATPADEHDPASRRYGGQLIRQVAALLAPPATAARTSHGRA